MDSAPSFNFLQKLPRPPQLGVTPRLTERSGAWRRRVASLTPGWYRARICPRVPAPGPSDTIAAGDRPSLVPGDLVRGLQLHRAVSASRMPWWSQPQRRMGPASCSMCGTGGRAAAEGRAMGQPGAQLGRTAQEPRPLLMAQMPSLPPLCSPLPSRTAQLPLGPGGEPLCPQVLHFPEGPLPLQVSESGCQGRGSEF